jgi:hypothetical protein
MRHISTKKKLQFLVLIAYEVTAGFIALFLDFNALWYLGISWVLPTLFFLYKLHINRYRYVIEALLWSIPGSLVVDWIGHYTRTWSYWDNPLFASSGFGVFGIPLESFLWGSLFWIFYVVVYEYFFDENRSSDFNNKEKLIVCSLGAISLSLVILINSYKPTIPLFYLLILLLFVFLTALALAPYRKLAPRVLKFSSIVFILGLIVEFFSLKLGLWLFPEGDFVRTILVSGQMVPVEEVAWWFIVPMFIAAVHEVFADNHK